MQFFDIAYYNTQKLGSITLNIEMSREADIFRVANLFGNKHQDDIGCANSEVDVLEKTSLKTSTYSI